MSRCPSGGTHVRCTKKNCPNTGKHCVKCGAKM